MGGIITEEGILPDPNKVKAITEMPAPSDKQGVQRFCGMANYLSSFCPNLSPTIKPLFELTQNGHEFIWSPTHQTAFENAKHLIASAPCLAYLSAQKPTS